MNNIGYEWENEWDNDGRIVENVGRMEKKHGKNYGSMGNMGSEEVTFRIWRDWFAGISFC